MIVNVTATASMVVTQLYQNKNNNLLLNVVKLCKQVFNSNSTFSADERQLCGDDARWHVPTGSGKVLQMHTSAVKYFQPCAL